MSDDSPRAMRERQAERFEAYKRYELLDGMTREQGESEADLTKALDLIEELAREDQRRAINSLSLRTTMFTKEAVLKSERDTLKARIAEVQQTRACAETGGHTWDVPIGETPPIGTVCTTCGRTKEDEVMS